MMMLSSFSSSVFIYSSSFGPLSFSTLSSSLCSGKDSEEIHRGQSKDFWGEDVSDIKDVYRCHAGPVQTGIQNTKELVLLYDCRPSCGRPGFKSPEWNVLAPGLVTLHTCKLLCMKVSAKGITTPKQVSQVFSFFI